MRKIERQLKNRFPIGSHVSEQRILQDFLKQVTHPPSLLSHAHTPFSHARALFSHAHTPLSHAHTPFTHTHHLATSVYHLTTPIHPHAPFGHITCSFLMCRTMMSVLYRQCYTSCCVAVSWSTDYRGKFSTEQDERMNQRSSTLVYY